MKVLVTGGAGFIGGNLCRELLAYSWVDEVRVIDDLSTGDAGALDGVDVRMQVGSILDRDLLAVVSNGVDAIVHLAALGSVPRSIVDPIASHNANATGTLNVLEAARKNGAHVILASSSSVYGANPAMPKVETLQLMPMSPYAVTKVATEQYAMSYAQCYSLDVLPFRFFNVFGPGQLPGHAYAAVVPVFVDTALDGRPLPVHGDGEQSRDFTFVGTVVETICEAIKGRVTASPTNLAFGTRTTLNEVARELGLILGRDLDVNHGDDRPGDVRHSQANNSQLRSLFPNVVPVNLQDGLHATVDWMRGRKHVS